jgi:Arabinose-binding domain of AraC transcription regulator, N-term
MASTTWSPDLRRPAYTTRVLCEVANERGIATSDLLAGTGITPGDLTDPEAVVTASDEIVAVRRLLAAVPDAAGLGIDVGSRFRLTHLGLFGFAVMSCATFRELFGVAMRYFSLTMLNIDVKLFDGAESCLLEFEVDHLPADVRGFFLERDVAGIVTTVGDSRCPSLRSMPIR